VRKDLETVFREEIRVWLKGEVSEATVARDIITVLDSKPSHEARVFAARLSDAALDYLVATEQRAAPEADPVPEADPDEPGPAAPDGPTPDPEPAPVDAVAETSPADADEEAA